MMKRKLSLEEIEFIADAIIPNPYISKDIAMCIVENLKQNIRKQLSNIETYPQNIPKLKDEIHKYYIRSQLDPSESVGCIAASSIGADTTQASLNSVEWNTRVLIDKNGTMKEDCIGRIIDDEYKNKGFTTVVYSGQIDNNIKNGNNPYAQVLDIDDENWQITSVDEDGKLCWNKITQLIRHPLYTGLIKVTTKTGRSVVATTGLSFLVMREGKIVPINGSELEIGDKLPVAFSMPKPDTIKTTLHLKDYLSPKRYIYGSDLWKAKEVREYYTNINKRGWWKNHNGIDFILPFRVPNVANKSVSINIRLNDEAIIEGSFLKGYIYNIKGNVYNRNVRHLIPEYMPLNEDFGFLIGAYISHGNIDGQRVAIYKSDNSYLKRIEFIVSNWGVNITNYTNSPLFKDHIRINSSIISKLLIHLCSKGNGKKYIPDFAYNAPDSFVKGMIDGLFSGNGLIFENHIEFTSSSEKLINGILYFLARINVYATKSTTLRSDNKCEKTTVRIYSTNVINFMDFMGNLTIESKDKQLKNIRDNIHNRINLENLFNDVIMDEIVSIENVETNTYVYDFTVEDTKNFIVQGNLCVRDSFHSAGIGKANLTGGLVRQNELLNASKKVKTPSCSIYLNKDMIDVNDLFKVKEFSNSNIRYYELQDMIDNITIENNPKLTEEETKYYNFFSNVFDDDYKGCEWRIRIDLKLDTLYKTKKTLLDITCAIYSCIDEEREYIGIVFYPDITGRLDIWVKDNIEEPETYIKTSKKKKLEVLEHHKEVIDTIINSDNKYQKFIKNILVPTIKLVPVNGIFGIEDCYYTQIKKTDEWMIDTKGSNYKELIIQPYIDFKKTKSNNMWDILETLGVEGAHSFLVEEFSKVITVNKRHLNILLDSMTFPGKIMSVSRYGIDRKNVGPLAKACFEQPVENFLISATKGEIDDIVGVTASITLGKLSRIGTGSIDLIIDEDKIKRELESMKLEDIKEEVDDDEELFLV
jgi:intein/homing endonuclease